MKKALPLKLITLENYLKLKYIYHHNKFFDNEIDFEGNTSSEILEATKEFLEFVGNKLDFKPKANQVCFKNFMLDSFKNHYQDTGSKNGSDFIDIPEAPNIVINFKESKALYCSTFLKKYFKF